MTHDSLHLRLQSWITLSRLNQCLGKPIPPFPNPVYSNVKEKVELRPKPSDIFYSPPKRFGSLHSVDRFSSADETIKRLEICTGANLSKVRTEVASNLLNYVPESEESKHWSQKIMCSGDMQITAESSDSILDNALDKVLKEQPVPDFLQNIFAQVYLSNDDPWSLLSTPLPDEEETEWPSEDELRKISRDHVEIGNLKQRLLLLASKRGISPDEIVIAARIKVHTWEDDFILYLWFEKEYSQQIDSRKCPSTFTGRTFILFFEDWLEPIIADQYPLAFIVGGHQRLSLSFTDFFPSQKWKHDFGWQPSSNTPLVWKSNDEEVVKHQRIHGPIRRSRRGHSRQPILDRWVITRTEFERINNEFGPFKMYDEFEHFKCDLER
jgi:hypothetical protein